MKYTLHTFFIVLGIMLLPSLTLATEIRVDTHTSETTTGEQFLVDVILHADEPLNALEGKVVFSENLLSVVEIRDGNSVINFWVEKPHLEKPGSVVFSGIAPGGFTGANNSIFSIVFEAVGTGMAAIALEGTKVLKNDGLGSEALFATHDTTVSVKEGDRSVRKEVIDDRDAPEGFTATMVQDPNLFNGAYTLVFATQDKLSGIDHYEVKEGKYAFYQKVESPYKIKHQRLERRIFIKAIDRAGNERLSVLPPQEPSPWYLQYALFAILFIAVSVLGLILKKICSSRIK